MTAVKTYRSQDGRHYFKFAFVSLAAHIEIHCLFHPGFAGQDSDVTKTHLYSSGRICFQSGREPRSMTEATTRAREWAEFFVRYRRTGKTEG